MPANKTEPTVGASTCASGNQTWKGTLGSLKQKPINKKNQIKKSLSSKK